MCRYNLMSICVIVVIISYIGSTVNALVGNICTSEMINQIANVNTTGVTIKVSKKEWVPESKISVTIDVGETNSIRNLIIWAETVDGEQPGTHVGSWSPISEHEYVAGCNGPANSTITNQLDLNLAQINYEWNAPSEIDATPSPQPNTPQPSTPQQSTSQPSTSQPTTSQPITSDRASPSPTCKPTKSKHHHKHPKNYLDLSDIKTPLISMTKKITESLTRRDQTSVGSIIFKGVIQLMNHPDEEIYYFTSDVISKSTSLDSDSQDSDDTSVMKVSGIDQSAPTDPPFSAGHSKFILKSHTLIGVLTLIVGFLTY